MSNTKMTDKQKVTTMADSDYVFGNFGGKVGQMSIPDFRSHLYDDSPDDESPELSALKSRISSVEDKNTEQDERINAAQETANSARETATAASAAAQEAKSTATAAQTTAHEAQTTAAALLQDTPWEGRHMNMFTETGEYHIHGERTDANDGLPILNAASGHTIDGLMTVLDSSLPNGNKYDVCVTQILRLNNRVGGDGHIFIRTGIAATKAELQKPTAGGWSAWEKLMGVFEKNMVNSASDLDKYTSSGMYDGMFVFSPESQTTVSGLKIESGSTFLMVAVNGYAVAQTGVVPQVTQLLYVMPSGLDGSSGVRNAKLYTRTGIYVATTKTYTWGNFDGLAHASDIAKVLGHLQETDVLVQENQSAISEIQKNISRIDERGLCDVNFIQERDGSLSIAKLGLDDRETKLEFPLATTTAAGAMSASDKIKLEGHVELGAFDTFAALFARAAKFDIVSNNAISLLHGTYRQAEGIYHGVLILQQVEKNNAGGGTAMQYIYIEKRQYTRYINFSATSVTEVQSVQNHGARNITLSGRVLQLKNMWGYNVGGGATLPDNSNLYEGTAGASSVPVVLSKTFGGTVTATLGAATSARAGVMTAEDKTRLDNLLTDIPWGGGRHMNVFIGKGDFHIYGERTDANDGLPILNAASGHTIDARLTVLDSSLTGGTGAKTDIVVTQILRLSNRTGGDGHVYVRTAQAATKAELTATDSTKWGTWEKLMGIFEKNVVANATDLDTYTTNGMYSGLFNFSGPYKQHYGLVIPAGSTFLMVTINGYAVAAYGAVPQLTQMLYLLPAKTGSEQFPAKMYIRTAWWNASAKDWVWNYWDKIVTANELSALEARVTALEKK